MTALNIPHSTMSDDTLNPNDMPPDHTRCNVLGVEISAVNIPLAVATIEHWVDTRQQNFVTITGVHGVMESQSDPELKKIHNEAGMVTPDGMPMVWMNKIRGNKHVSRVYGPDLMLAVSEVSARKGYKHFYYGGNDGVADLLKEKLTARFPGLQVVGTYCPPFRKLTADEDASVCKMIDDSGADVVWVGLSTPKQEFWMHGHMGRIKTPVMIGVGAAFDFHAGLKSQAPAWMQKSGMEWFYRLCTEPKRLWKRYLRNNPLFVFNVTLQLLGLKKFETGKQ